MHELAAGCGRRGQCAPNRSPSRASVTPCAVGAPSLGLRARLPSPDHLTPCSRTRRRTADGSRTAQIASHGRLTACRSRLTGYPDRAYDRRASPFFRRGALCMLACVVQGSCVHSVGFRTAVCVIRRPLFNLGSHTTLKDTHYREQARECVLELELLRCVAKWLTGRYSRRSRISMHISKDLLRLAE